MAGNEVDYAAFGTFYNAVMSGLGADSQATDSNGAGWQAGISQGVQTTGSVGIEQAMFFKAMNKQSLYSLGWFMKDQAIGRRALAEAAANVALAYHDGDLGQKAEVFDVMNGILSPNGKGGTVRETMDKAAKEAESSTTKKDSDASKAAPPPTYNENGDIVDSQNRVLFKADGSPGDPQALKEAGITPGANGATASKDASYSPYLAYINSVNAAQRQYYGNWTGVGPNAIGTNPDQLPKKTDNLPKDKDALAKAFPELVKPTNDYETPACIAPPKEEPKTPPDLSVYDDPEPDPEPKRKQQAAGG